MEEILKAVNAHFGFGVIKDVYFVERDENGVIRKVTPCVQTDGTPKDLIGKLLTTCDALKFMAGDIVNRSLPKN